MKKSFTESAAYRLWETTVGKPSAALRTIILSYCRKNKITPSLSQLEAITDKASPMMSLDELVSIIKDECKQKN